MSLGRSLVWDMSNMSKIFWDVFTAAGLLLSHLSIRNWDAHTSFHIGPGGQQSTLHSHTCNCKGRFFSTWTSLCQHLFIFFQLLVSIFSPSPRPMAQHSELQPPLDAAAPPAGAPCSPPALAETGCLQGPKQQHLGVFNQRFMDLNEKGYSDSAITSPVWLSERTPGFHGQFLESITIEEWTSSSKSPLWYAGELNPELSLN